MSRALLVVTTKTAAVKAMNQKTLAQLLLLLALHLHLCLAQHPRPLQLLRQLRAPALLLQVLDPVRRK